jgi:uncharacterized iron-regulated membrane protein
MQQRNRISTLHGFIGILGGLFLVVMGLTGSAIVFHQEIDHTLNAPLMQVVPQGKPVAIDTFWNSVQTSVPGGRLESIQMPQTQNETYRFELKAKDKTLWEVFVHPYTGKVLGMRQGERTPFMSLLYNLHHDLSAGNFGLWLVGFSGLILMLQSITGLMLWTGWRKLASGFRIRWGAPTRLLSFDLHNVGGIIANLLLLISGLTGVVIVGAHILLAPPAEVAKVPPSFQPKVALSELLRKADSAIPNGVTTSVSFPDAQTIVVAKKLPQDHARFYFSSVTLDGLTGQILEVNQVSDPVPMWKFLMAIADLHFGTFGGLPTRILYLFLGCMPTLLFATGLVNWRRRRRLPTRQEQELSLPKQTQANTVP